MARTALTVKNYGRGPARLRVDNIAVVNGDVANGHTVPNDGATAFDVANTSVDTDYDVTVHVRGDVEGQSVTVVETVTHGQTLGFGPYPVSVYGANLLVDVENAALHFTRVFRLPV
jgi:hypothetical protein